jgi:lysophospholipase L1-like esterase
MPEVRDDSEMSRFDRWGLRRFTARQAIWSIGLVTLLLVLFAGQAIRKQGEEMSPGIARDVVLAVGDPAGWLADRLPLADLASNATSWLSPDESLAGASHGFAARQQRLPAGGGGQAGDGGVPAVTPDYFDPAALGEKVERRPLHTLLVTGDSLSTPLDIELAQRLTDSGVDVIRDPHLATGISKTGLVDWGRLSTTQVQHDHPDAVVVFIGANEGFPMPGPGGKDVNCCGPDWASIYAGRVRQMMETYRQGGRARVYWLTVPTPRDSARQPIERAVNAAIAVAAEPFAAFTRILDMVPIFTPGDRYRDSMTVDGEPTIVREADGIHLNEAGSAIAADAVLKALGRDYTW